ncbi:hypothetical protein ABZ348_11725 [Streptomyces sp. NPDC005963]|uniref:hypothetical protein n=1 Tax=Streptomyces sp. NPDC005963 TaxID=3156721 RepID=UPI0033C84FFE
MTSFIVSPLVLTRVAGLPSEALDLVTPATRKLLAEHGTAAERLGTLAPELTDVLFALVPGLDDDVPLRRKVLAAKRSVNRLDPLPWDADVRRRVAERLTVDSARLLDDWCRLVDEQHALIRQLGAQLAQDREQAVEALHRALVPGGDPAGGVEGCGFAESLAIAAPDWVRHRDRKARSAKKLKTLYSYVARAAVKTSPFSGLTSVGEAGTQGQGRGLSRTSATTAYLALRRLAHDPATAGLLRYRVAPVHPGTATEPDGLLLHSEVTITEGVVWRNDRVVEADHALSPLTGLASATTFAELLEAVGGERPFTRFLRLLDAGILQPVPPWAKGEPPFTALAALLADGETISPIPHHDLSLAHRLGEGASRADTEGRIVAANELRDLTADWNDHRDRGERKPSGLIYEDRESGLDLPDPLGVPEVREDLAALGERVRPHLFRSHLYDFLLESFTAEFGAGGVCRDPLGFLMRLTVDRDSNPPLERALFADMTSRQNPGDRAWLPVGPTSAPPNAGVFFQIEAASRTDAEAGRHRLVVNQYGAGTGALFSRFSGLLGDGFRDRLTGYLQRCWPDVSCREMVVWTDCNTVQSECGGLLPPLVLPGEVEARNGTTLDELALVHDARTDTLSLFDRNGDPVGLAYLGLIPQHLLQSYVRLLAILADPWVNGSPHSDYTMTKAHELGPLCGDGVGELPRITDGPGGRLITRRASWIVPASAIPGPEGGDVDEAALAVRLDAFRREHGIPEEVFVHQLGSPGGALGMMADRKPLWVSMASPLSVGVLHHWLSPQTSHLRLVEVLPERSLHTQRDVLGRPRVTEHVALLAWPEENR